MNSQVKFLRSLDCEYVHADFFRRICRSVKNWRWGGALSPGSLSLSGPSLSLSGLSLSLLDSANTLCASHRVRALLEDAHWRLLHAYDALPSSVHLLVKVHFRRLPAHRALPLVGDCEVDWARAGAVPARDAVVGGHLVRPRGGAVCNRARSGHPLEWEARGALQQIQRPERVATLHRPVPELAARSALVCGSEVRAVETAA